MRMIPWDELPPQMRNDAVREYYDILNKKKGELIKKRIFDIGMSSALLFLFAPLFLILAFAIKLDSPGPVFYRQERVTQYGKIFKIHKFRTMIDDADRRGSLVTVKNDKRVTSVGHFIRKCRLDEVSQLIDVFTGNMTFVGTRPEVVKYVRQYSPEMWATLLLPAGVTSEASILYKDEEKLLSDTEDVDKVYVEMVLPGKMEYNLRSIREFSVCKEIITMIRTVGAIFGQV